MKYNELVTLYFNYLSWNTKQIVRAMKKLKISTITSQEKNFVYDKLVSFEVRWLITQV